MDATAVIVLVGLLILPGMALSRLAGSADTRGLVIAPVAMSLFAFFAYRSDKRRAEAGEWRIPESTLHLAALLGGWPGAWLAQRMYRHKTVKASFQFTFWLIVAVHQFVAFDSLVQWRYTRELIAFARSRMT